MIGPAVWQLCWVLRVKAGVWNLGTANTSAWAFWAAFSKTSQCGRKPGQEQLHPSEREKQQHDGVIQQSWVSPTAPGWCSSLTGEVSVWNDNREHMNPAGFVLGNLDEAITTHLESPSGSSWSCNTPAATSSIREVQINTASIYLSSSFPQESLWKYSMGCGRALRGVSYPEERAGAAAAVLNTCTALTRGLLISTYTGTQS